MLFLNGLIMANEASVIGWKMLTAIYLLGWSTNGSQIPVFKFSGILFFLMSGKLSNALSIFVTQWLPTLVFRWLLLDGLRISYSVVMSIPVGPPRHHTSLYIFSCALFKWCHWEPCEFHTVLLLFFFCCARGDNRDLAWWKRPPPT